MRIACYGFVEKGVGSVAGANFMLLEQLLVNGHEIDFYAIRSFVYPEQLFEFENFRYLSVENELSARFATLPGFIRKPLAPVLEPAFYKRCMRRLGRMLAAEHRDRSYEAALFLGIPAQFKVTIAPVVSWVQGPPQTEWQAIRANRKTIVELCGIRLYAMLRVYYVYKAALARSEFGNSGHVICGSEWARSRIIDYGFPPHRVSALPYPVDTSFFYPGRPQSPRPGRTLLWLGRIDPRKRLDLLMDAFELLLKDRDDVRLLIVGGFPYAGGYRNLIDRFRRPDRVEYRTHVDRGNVPELIRSVDAVVQPSESENFGSSVAEALCCGKPVITGPTNGTGEFAGEMSFRFDAYTPESVAGAMRDCLQAIESDPDRIKTRSREIGEANFAVPTVTRKLESILESVRRGEGQHARVPPSPVLKETA